MKWLLNLIDAIMSRFYSVPSTDHSITEIPIVPEAPELPVEEVLSFLTPKEAFHATRVLCDKAGLTFYEKNVICACIYQESQFKNEAVGKNSTSTDWGIVQVNDYWHIGKGRTFPSKAYVLDNPDKMVQWMIDMYKIGHLKLWVSYTSGAYKKWLVDNSAMWKLSK